MVFFISKFWISTSDTELKRLHFKKNDDNVKHIVVLVTDVKGDSRFKQNERLKRFISLSRNNITQL